MANNVADAYQLQFTTNTQLLVQQLTSRIRNAVLTGTHTGSEQASVVDQFASTTVTKRVTRFEPKVNTDIVNSRRWVLPESFSTHSLVDNFDVIRTRIQFNSPYLRSQVAAMNREIDDSIIEAFFGTAQTGKLGTTAETWTGTDIAVGTTDLTVTKLLDAQQALLEADVDMDNDADRIFCIITPHQNTTLINSQEINNADFIDDKVFDRNTRNLTNGMHGRNWFGIRFIVSNRLTDTNGVRAAAGTSAIRAIPMYAMSGMHFGLWDDVRGVIVERKDLKDDPPEMSVYGTFGATRLEISKLVRIICDET